MLDSQPKRTSIREILLAVKQRLVAKEVLPSGLIKILASRNTVPKIQAEQMLFLRPGGRITGRKQNDGEGRIAAKIYRRLEIVVVNRVSLDAVDEDEIFLTNATQGIFVPDEDCEEALDLFWPTDSDNNVLTFEPMRSLSASAVKKDFKPGWGDEILLYEVGYLAPYTERLINDAQ